MTQNRLQKQANRATIQARKYRATANANDTDTLERPFWAQAADTAQLQADTLRETAALLGE